MAKKSSKKPEKAQKSRKKPKILKWPNKPKKARIFSGHSVQDCLKRTLVYMGIFFIEAITDLITVYVFLNNQAVKLSYHYDLLKS